MSVKHAPLLSELLRPAELNDLLLPERDIDRLRNMISTGRLQNLLFFGSPGRGKTSAARILQRALDVECEELNGSKVASDKAMEKQITDFAQSTTIFLKPKVLLIDEADYLLTKTQQSMRHIIENSSDRCRFILTANNANRIIDPLKSRLTEVNFDLPIREKQALVERLKARIPGKLTSIGVVFDKTRIEELINLYYPDVRRIVNRIELEFTID